MPNQQQNRNTTLSITRKGPSERQDPALPTRTQTLAPSTRKPEGGTGQTHQLGKDSTNNKNYKLQAAENRPQAQ